MVRNINYAFKQVQKNIWERKDIIANELDGKTIGIIGYGRLGKIISKYAKTFDMNVLIHDIRDVSNEKNKWEKIVSLTKLLADSDVICLMISYSAENINFIDYNKILKMKDGVVFINTSRGEMVNETDLIKALKIGKISSAGLDVLNDDSIWSGKLKKFPK